MRMPSRQEHLLAGADAEAWEPRLPAGGATWRGDRVQVAAVGQPEPQRCDVAHTEEPVELRDLGAGVPLVVVSTRPVDIAGRLRAAGIGGQLLELGAAGADPRTVLVGHGGAADVLVGDPESWQARWGVIGALRESANVLVDGCTVGEFRAVTGSRVLPPPPGRGERALWLLQRDGHVRRAQPLPAAASNASESWPISPTHG